MFKNTINGLGDLLESDISTGKVILVTGPPGGMKSGFTYSLMSKELKDTKNFGLYITLEESSASIKENMTSLRAETIDNLFISDHTDIRARFERGKGDLDLPRCSGTSEFLNMILGVTKFFKNQHGDNFTCFALDSIGALYSIINPDNLRSDMFYFIKELRKNNLTSFLIMETANGSSTGAIGGVGSEAFLADGIIEMGMIETRDEVQRYLQIKKMRATKHDMKKYAIDVTSEGISVIGRTFED